MSQDREPRNAESPSAAPRSNASLAASMVGIVVGMVCLTFAAVPLYDMFCRVTGYGGTTMVAEKAPDTPLERRMIIRFNADTAKELPWQFKADERAVEVRVGEERLTSFTAKNSGTEPVVGTAIYNVTPLLASKYFNKIQCFCFENQLLKPGEEMHMPVSFFIDPEIENDPFLKDLKTVTLSYTFFLSKNQSVEGRNAP